jgi:hypothetical protein
MISDVEALRLVGWPGLALLAFALWYTVLPIARANGERPFLLGYALIALLVCTHSIGALYLAYRLDSLEATGIARMASFYSRVFPALVGLVVIWTGYTFRRSHS